MKWFKFIPVGLFVVSAFMEAVQEDGKISVKEILDIGIEAAKRAGYDVADIKWELFDQKDLEELEERPSSAAENL
jgi:hypothetical protein